MAHVHQPPRTSPPIARDQAEPGPVGEPPFLLWATPDEDNGGPRMLSGLVEGARKPGAREQSDALSAGQVHAAHDLSMMRTWSLTFVNSA